MRDLLHGIAFLIGIPLSVTFFRMAWTLWRMPEWQQRELRERYAKRMHEQRMINFWLSGGKIKGNGHV